MVLQIYSTRSVGDRITDKQSLHQALAKHASIAAAKLRKQGSVCGTLIAFASNSPFDESPQSFKILKHFHPSVNDTTVLIKSITDNINQLFKANVRYYKIGVGLLDLSEEKHLQLELFSTVKQNNKLMSVLDSINQRYGTDTAFLAAQGSEQKWTMRRQFLTPQYTTKWSDIPKIKC